MRSIFAVLAAFAFSLAPPGFDQTAQAQSGGGQQVRLVGTVTSFADQTLVLKSGSGEQLSIALKPKTRVSFNVRKSLADIKPGDKVGVTSVISRDRKHRAVEVRIFPKERTPRLRQFPLPYAPENIMTNAAVAEVVKIAEGSVLKVRFPDGETDIIVGPHVPVLASKRGTQALLKPGAKIKVYARKGKDGALTVRRVTVD